MPTLNEVRQSSISERVVSEVWKVRIGRCVTPSEEVSPKKPSMVTSGPAPLWSRMDKKTIVLVGQRSVGELTANDTRRVELGAKC